MKFDVFLSVLYLSMYMLCDCPLRVQQQEAEKEQQSREILEKRMQAIKSLKSNIEATQVSNSTHMLLLQSSCDI